MLLVLYRFLQEETTNILKHAAAQNVTIEVELGSNEGTARVTDDGVGFDVSTVNSGAAPSDERLGLRGLMRRFELIGGTLDIRSSAAGGGTTLVAHVPRDPLVLIGRDDDSDTRIDR